MPTEDNMRQCSGCREPKHTHIDTKMTVLEVVKEEHEYGEALLILLKTRRGVKYQTRVFENIFLRTYFIR